LDPQTFACGALDDLAIAMSGNAPSSTSVTRFAGVVPRGAFGEDLAIAFDATGVEHPSSVRAGFYEVCKGTTPNGPVTSGGGSNGSGLGGGGGGGGGAGGGSEDVTYVTTSDGCGGSTTETVADDT